MATVDRPVLLASTEGLAAGSTSTEFGSTANSSWEVHSIVASGACTIQRKFDPGESGTLGSAVTVGSLSGADELHGLKLEVNASSTNPESTLSVVNDTTGTIDVYLTGVKIT